MKFTHLLMALAITVPGVAHAAATPLVTNGDFETTTTTSTNGEFELTPNGTYGTVAGWSQSNSPSGNPFNLLFTTNGIAAGSTISSSTPGSPSNPSDAIPASSNQYGTGQYLTSGFNKTSPTGGNFLALDGDTNVNGTISQTINNLTVGTNYQLVFDWAAAQINTRSGPTTESLQVGFGNSVQSTGIQSIGTNGFSGWIQQSFLVKATSMSQVLSFLSVGTPNGSPPVALLDGVSLVAAPEPSTIAVFGVGLLGLAAFGFRRHRRGSTTA